MPCPAGTFNPFLAQGTCSNCGAGFYNHEIGVVSQAGCLVSEVGEKERNDNKETESEEKEEMKKLTKVKTSIHFASHFFSSGLSFWLLLSLFKYERTARVSHRFLLY
jgi:hypothetical protein